MTLKRQKYSGYCIISYTTSIYSDLPSVVVWEVKGVFVWALDSKLDGLKVCYIIYTSHETYLITIDGACVTCGTISGILSVD